MRATLAVSLAVLAVAPAASATRGPTYLERVTIMDAFNIPGRSFSSKCVKILVSTADPRYAMLTGPSPTPAACQRAGEVGNGYVVFARVSKTALRWRIVTESSWADPAPCSLSRAARVDLFRSAKCA